ncbi:MAG: thioredoxin domain-containing protein [Actinobacteria bacterium]|nr:thioredoxin domain-containing protein [Actinomycetota bacterium]MCB8998302.1 thioredoxin domain-containing protein [Actinomycetota bacterium]MCB9414969.1 thioredoxin domain-containing protein [Actinomycetota bacterium]MCB9424869.1 thioredoxin domain-containing protein [Actinomycetota bacterium]HNL51942.1 thioredoxin domain-containing protein [Actinomycetota bacterium]
MAEKNESAKSTREKAAEARAAAQAAERRRERTIRIVGGIAVLAVVAIILGIGVMQSRKDDTPAPSADSALPTGVTAETGYAFQVNTAEGKPTVEIFEDFQCPACANLEATYGPMIQEEAAAGNIQLSYRIMTFLDNNLNTEYSLNAANAFGCAITAGVGEQYHNTVYANQPANEGDGWTDEQLKQFGADAGLSGDAQTQFDKCVDEGTYKGWAQLSNEAAFSAGVTGTPTIFVNGKELPSSALQSEEALQEALTNPQQ